ncbi:MAG: glutamyl-tRNA(Gln) amidotransferase, subunit [Verrucomicrobiales bacterium]|nr:glutamyl-tRNA(Gln) amidotransferase, subunit [Verrucomicrobiales bacterium]
MPQEEHINVRYVAGLARLTLTPEEESAYAGQLDRILHYVAQLDSVDVSSVPEHTLEDGGCDFTRPDTARPSQPMEDALLNAPRRSQDQFLVPKVVE